MTDMRMIVLSRIDDVVLVWCSVWEQWALRFSLNKMLRCPGFGRRGM